MSDILNKITKNLTDNGIQVKYLSDEDCYLTTNLSIEKFESIVRLNDEIKFELIRVENITYN